MNATKTNDILNQFITQWKEYDRTGAADLRRQVEEDIRCVAPRAVAEKILKDLRGK